jgi:hypothetical protein
MLQNKLQRWSDEDTDQNICSITEFVHLHLRNLKPNANGEEFHPKQIALQRNRADVSARRKIT